MELLTKIVETETLLSAKKTKAKWYVSIEGKKLYKTMKNVK